jgi:hypothetical protein
MTKINAATLPWPVPEGLLQILQEIVEGNTGAVIINFRSPGYSPTQGGFHPVEIMVSKTGQILYITDFSYVSMPPYEELAKEIDFDFSENSFQHQGREYELGEGRGLFKIWSRNFTTYFKMGVFEVSVTEVEEI